MTGCSKIPYPTVLAARLAMRAIQRRTVTRGGTTPQGVYPCPACHAWHLTSQQISGKAWWAKPRRPARDATD
jgi:hypothetical protein